MTWLNDTFIRTTASDFEAEERLLAKWGRKSTSPAMARAIAKIEAQAVRTAKRAVKDRARAYSLRPKELDSICDGLSFLSPKAMVWVIRAATNHQPNRWFGFGGEIPAINMRGAMLYARWSRRVANRRKS